MSYIGIPPFGQTIRTVTNVTATAGQTTFNITGGYIVGYVDVYLNGVLLAPTDYTATDTLTVVLASGASLNDEFQAVSYQTVSLADTYRESEVDALLAGKADQATTYTKTETDNLLDDKADQATTYTKTETDNLLDDKVDTADIGVTVQAYDSNLTSFVGTFTLPTTDGTNGQVLQTNGSGTLSFNTPEAGVSTGKAIAMAIVFG